MKDRSITVRLTAREYAALRNYAEAFHVSIASCVRVAVLPDIPPHYWPSTEPAIKGQLSLVEESA